MALAYQIHLVYVPLHLCAPDAVCLYERTPAASQAQLQDCSKDTGFELDHFALLRAAFVTAVLSTKCCLTLITMCSEKITGFRRNWFFSFLSSFPVALAERTLHTDGFTCGFWERNAPWCPTWDRSLCRAARAIGRGIKATKGQLRVSFISCWKKAACRSVWLKRNLNRPFRSSGGLPETKTRGFIYSSVGRKSHHVLVCASEAEQGGSCRVWSTMR